jgi:hypothetical protein
LTDQYFEAGGSKPAMNMRGYPVLSGQVVRLDEAVLPKVFHEPMTWQPITAAL